MRCKCFVRRFEPSESPSVQVTAKFDRTKDLILEKYLPFTGLQTYGANVSQVRIMSALNAVHLLQFWSCAKMYN